VRGGQPGQTRSPSHPLLVPRRPPRWTLRALQHLDAVDAPSSALGRHKRSTDALRRSPRSVTRPPTRRQPLRWGNARFRDCGSPSVCATPRRRTSPPPIPTWWHAGPVLAAMPRWSGTPVPPPTTSRPTTLPASCHPPPHMGTRSGTSPAYRTQYCFGGSSLHLTPTVAAPSFPSLHAGRRFSPPLVHRRRPREGRSSSSHARNCRRLCSVAGDPHAGSTSATAVVRVAQGGPPCPRSLQWLAPSSAQR
jgi:hypothetical protein